VLAGPIIDGANAVGEEPQGSLRGNLRIKLSQAAGSGVAGVNELAFALSTLDLVQALKVGSKNQHFTANLKDLGCGDWACS
jgi:hypothetical protein